MRKVSCLLGAVVFLLAACGDGGQSGAPADPSVTSTTAGEARAERTAEDAARAWVAAVASGDWDEAWSLVGEPSRDAIGGRQKFDANRTDLSEGWGAWAMGTDVSYRAVALPDAQRDDGFVVILAGAVAQEGPARRTAASLLARVVDGAGKVEPFVDLGNVEFSPESGSEISSQPTFNAFVLAGRSVWFVVDNQGPERPAVEGADGDQQRATLAVGPALAPGHHSLTVVLERHGEVSTRTASYTVSDAPLTARDCGTVSFTPNSEDAASSIRATGLTCDEAEAFVQVAGRQTSSGGPAELTVDGYRCVRTAAVDDPLPRSSYECRKGAKTVSFDRT